jgi:hypothetical protein
LHFSILLHLLNVLMSVNIQRCFLFVHSHSFTTCFGLMRPSSGVQLSMEPAALLCRLCHPLSMGMIGGEIAPHVL